MKARQGAEFIVTSGAFDWDAVANDGPAAPYFAAALIDSTTYTPSKITLLGREIVTDNWAVVATHIQDPSHRSQPLANRGVSNAVLTCDTIIWTAPIAGNPCDIALYLNVDDDDANGILLAYFDTASGGITLPATPNGQLFEYRVPNGLVAF